MSNILKLGSLAVIAAGQGAPQGSENYSNNGTPFIKAGDIADLAAGKSELDVQKVSLETATTHRLKLFPKGTVLFAKSGMSCMKGIVHVLGMDCYVVSHLACITPHSIESSFLKYYLEFHRPNKLVKDAAYPSISLADIAEMDISVPTEADRKQIIASLDAICELIRLRKLQLKELDEFVKSRFIELFGADEYPTIDLINLIVDGAGLSYGIVQPGDDGTGDMGVLRPVDIVDGTISMKAIKYIDRSIGDGYRKTELAGDELLITVRGSTGLTALTDPRFCGMNVTRGIAVIRYDRNKVNPKYLNAYLSNDESQRYIQEHTRGATLQQINLSDLRIMQIKLPPLALQEQFAAFVEQTDKSKYYSSQSYRYCQQAARNYRQEWMTCRTSNS